MFFSLYFRFSFHFTCNTVKSGVQRITGTGNIWHSHKHSDTGEEIRKRERELVILKYFAILIHNSKNFPVTSILHNGRYCANTSLSGQI